MEIDLSKRPEGATHWSSENGDRCEAYWRPNRDGYDCCRMDAATPAWQGVSDYLPDYAIPLVDFSEQIQEGIDDADAGRLKPLSEVKAKYVWDGQGLPPVGAVCEYQTWVNREWKQTKVLAHHLGFAVHSWSVDGDDMEVDSAPPQDFRPIRTPEQVAAEAREKAIQYMRDEISWTTPKLGPCPIAMLYDAGYRKQVEE